MYTLLGFWEKLNKVFVKKLYFEFCSVFFFFYCPDKKSTFFAIFFRKFLARSVEEVCPKNSSPAVFHRKFEKIFFWCFKKNFSRIFAKKSKRWTFYAKFFNFFPYQLQMFEFLHKLHLLSFLLRPNMTRKIFSIKK